MPVDIDCPRLPFDDFVRRFPLRAPKLMWLLGAGASASAGIPTALDMIWQFRRALFLSQNRSASQPAAADLSQPTIRSRIIAHIASLGGMPSPGAPDEYSALFEAAYPSEADRQAFLEAQVSGAKPSYGHLALATLMRERLTRLVWTTNFDALIADSCAKIFDTTSALTTATLDSADLARQAIVDERWPAEIKLHGDFRSRRLKNTSDELRCQDARLRSLLVDSCQRFGLIVVGYSGRDDSVMDALQDAIEQDTAFPSGLFWLHRGQDLPLPRVTQLLARGASNGKEVALVTVDNFDEILRDLIRMIPDIDTTTVDDFAASRRAWSPTPLRRGRRSAWPVVRLNALPLVAVPSVCRLVVCDIGGTADVRAAVHSAGVDVLAVRSRVGVLAFGTDASIRSAFGPHDITRFDLHTLDAGRQRYESTERGLLHDCLITALSRESRLTPIDSRGRRLAPDNPQDPAWKPLRQIVGELQGTVNGHPSLQWREGVAVRLDWANDRLWLLIEPRTVFDGLTDENRAAATDFARERTVSRYNRQLNALIDFWAQHLAQDGRELRALKVVDGVDAIFRLSSVTAFSRRLLS